MLAIAIIRNLVFNDATTHADDGKVKAGEFTNLEPDEGFVDGSRVFCSRVSFVTKVM